MASVKNCVLLLFIILLPFGSAQGDECSQALQDAVFIKKDLSNRSFAACCKPDEAVACMPPLKERLTKILNEGANGRELLDLRYVVPAILRLGTAEDVREISRVYSTSSADSILGPLFAEAFLEKKLFDLISELQLTSEQLFPAAQIEAIAEPVEVQAASTELRKGYRMYQAMKQAEAAARDCDLTSPAPAKAEASRFWSSLSRYLLEGGELKLDIPPSICKCGLETGSVSQVIMGLKMVNLLENGQGSTFARAYAIAWRKIDFKYRRLCAYSGLGYFNAGADRLFENAGVDRELIYIGALLSGDESLDYGALADNRTEQTRARLEQVSILLRNRPEEKLVNAVLKTVP